ncbi:MFS transporter [Sporobolomyces salmoneus]|uniref:MFS transporter n=1 Tax=Sporobolomyces salmoneus TaxID=183962 RepID=UPI00317F0F15
MPSSDKDDGVLDEPITLSTTVPIAPLEPASSPKTKSDRIDGSHDSTGTKSEEEDQDSNITLHDAEPASSATVEKDLGKLEKGGISQEDEEEEKYYTEDGTQIIVVQWKGQDDPANPLNWSNARRMTSTFIVAAFTLVAPLSSSAIAPAAPQVGEALGITSELELSMVTSIFVLGFAIGPLVLAPASELYGRVRILQSANVFYIIFNLVCAFAKTKGQFIAFRFLAGLGGGAPLAIGAGVLSDLWRPEERGRSAALYALGPLLGPALGPIIGGFAATIPSGWKWVFWSTSMFSALVQVFGLVLLRETYHPVLLKKQASELKKSMDLPKDSDRVQTIFEVKAGGKKSPLEVFEHGMVRPFVLFWHEPILQVITLYMSLLYGIIYMMLVSTTTIFENIYNQSVGIAGLNFIAMGLGFFAAAQGGARLLDVVYRRLKVRYNSPGRPEFRLPFQFPAAILLPLGLLLYGFAAERRLHWIVVDIGLFLISFAIIIVFNSSQIYLLDCFKHYSASAVATAVFFRSLFGFGLPLAAPYMWSTLGYGYGAVLLAVAAILISWPSVPILWFYGERIRMRSKFAKKDNA